jgi:cell division control protein 24
MVSRLLDMMVQQNIIEDLRPDQIAAHSGKRSQRQHIVEELVQTERTYVQHLELLQAFKQLCEGKGVVSGDVSHQIFHNLDALLNFQRRFLIRVEQTNAIAEDEQNWGKIFIQANEGFMVYEPYIANQKLCEEVVMREFAKLKEAGGTIDMRQLVESPPTLYGFLMKPFQRLSKYPLLLDSLYQKGDYSEDIKADLFKGKECATTVLTRTNTAIENEDRLEALEDLKSRVEDWKGHRVTGFGGLLLFGSYTVIKSDSAPGKDQEREYHVYFFESILLCCKDIDRNKPKNKISTRSMVDKKGRPKMQLKGRIFMQNVTDVVKASKPGSYTCQIFWKGDPGIENFVVRFPTEDTMSKWYSKLLEQKAVCNDLARRSDSTTASHRPSIGTSATDFTYIQQNQGDLVNPWKEADDDDEEGTVVPQSPFPAYGPHSSFESSTMSSRNASMTSLRSRSTTGESGPPLSLGGRMPPPRLPANPAGGHPSLSLRTQQLPYAQSPSMEKDSYFSPVETPLPSQRTSGSSSMSYFPTQFHDNQTRYTAPAMTRTASRENNVAASSYAASQRTSGPRPGLVGLHSTQQVPPSRNRSASSPDINHISRRAANGSRPPVPDVPVPPFPAQYSVNSSAPRSQSNSPSLAHPPVQSPQQRERSSTRSNADGLYAHDGPPALRVNPGLAYVASSRTNTPTPGPSGGYDSPISPPLSSSSEFGLSQLKIKVHASSTVLTLVVPLNITYHSLRDRIDAKLSRSTNISLSDRSPNQVKLKYLDEDDYVSIQSDEDVQSAFETWREQRGETVGGMGEIELFCQ